MTESLQSPQPLAQQALPKEKKVRVRSIGCLWFFVVILLAAVGLCGTGVYLLHQEFVRVYADLDKDAQEVSGSLAGIERDLKAAEKERGSLAAEFKGMRSQLEDLNKEREALVRGWEQMKKATVAYQGSLQTILDDLRRKKEMTAALEQRSTTADRSVEVGVVEVKEKKR